MKLVVLGRLARYLPALGCKTAHGFGRSDLGGERATNQSESDLAQRDDRELTHDFAATGTHRPSRPRSCPNPLSPFFAP